MSSVYPGTLDSIPTNKTNRTRNPTDHPDHHNLMASAINAVEATLGVNPQGAYATLVARLDAGASALPRTTLTGVLDGAGNAIRGIVVTPTNDNENGIIFRRPDSTYGQDFVYGKTQAWQIIKEGTGSVKNTLILARADGRHGGIGSAGGYHMAPGLHDDGDWGLTQGNWIQMFQDVVGEVMTLFGTSPVQDAYLVTDGSSNLRWRVSSNGVQELHSKGTSDAPYFLIGRGPSGLEAVLGVAAAAAQFTANAVAGDVVLKATKAGGATLRLAAVDSGDGPTSQFARLLVKKDKVIVGFDDVSGSGRLYGGSSLFAIQHNDAAAYQLSMNANGGLFLNGASDTYPIDLRVANASVAKLKAAGLDLLTTGKIFNSADGSADGDLVTIGQRRKGVVSAYRNAALNLAASSASTIIGYDTTDFEVNAGWMDVTTNKGRWTPQVAGYYRISWAVSATGIPTGKVMYSALYKNGAISKIGSIQQTSNAGSVGSMGSAVVLMNGTTDYVEISGVQSDTVVHALVVGSPYTHFEAHYLGKD